MTATAAGRRALVPIGIQPDGPASFVVDLDTSWTAGKAIAGGISAAHLIEAARVAVAAADAPVRSALVQFLRPVQAGPAHLRVQTLLLRASAAVQVSLHQDGEPSVLALVRLGPDAPSPSFVHVQAPPVPEPERCHPLPPRPEEPPFVAHVEYRPVDGLPLSGAAEARYLVWMRIVGADDLDQAGLAILADATAPVVLARLTEPVPVPTTELALTYTGLGTAGPWVLMAARNVVTHAGYALEDFELYGREGRLLARAQQTRRYLAAAGARMASERHRGERPRGAEQEPAR